MIGDKRRIGNFEHLPHMSFEDFKIIAIHELDPHGRFTIEDGVMTWDKINVNPKPSDEDIEAKATELQKLHADLEYSRIRTKVNQQNIQLQQLQIKMELKQQQQL